MSVIVLEARFCVVDVLLPVIDWKFCVYAEPVKAIGVAMAGNPETITPIETPIRMQRSRSRTQNDDRRMAGISGGARKLLAKQSCERCLRIAFSAKANLRVKSA